jgi:hypothetical protein
MRASCWAMSANSTPRPAAVGRGLAGGRACMSPLMARRKRKCRNVPAISGAGVDRLCHQPACICCLAQHTHDCRRGLSVRCRCSNRSNFGKPLDCVRVVPADGGFPRGRSLRGDVIRALVETGSVMGSARSRSGTSTCDSSQSISATRFAVMRTLPGLLGLPWTTHVGRPTNRAHAARHRATPSGGIALRSIFVPVSARRRSVDDCQPGRCGQPSVNRCSRRSVLAK